MTASSQSTSLNAGATHWPIVWIAFGAGIVAAAHIGKLPPALTEIRAELEERLRSSG